jgi:hypothetical protein
VTLLRRSDLTSRVFVRYIAQPRHLFYLTALLARRYLLNDIGSGIEKAFAESVTTVARPWVSPRNHAAPRFGKRGDEGFDEGVWD